MKAVADAVWARLSGSFSKDVLHAQHVYMFAQILRAGKASKGVRECSYILSNCFSVMSRDAVQGTLLDCCR